MAGNNLKGMVAVVDQQYYTLSAVDTQAGTMTLTDAQGKTRLLSNVENTAHDLAIYQPRDIQVSEGIRSALPAPSMSMAMSPTASGRSRASRRMAPWCSAMAAKRKPCAQGSSKKTNISIWAMP